MTVRRETLITAQIIAAALAVSALAGITATPGHAKLLLVVAAAIPLTWAIAQPWGAAAAAAPVLLLPTLPKIGHPLLAMSILAVVLAAGHWHIGAGRPPLSRSALATVVFFGATTFLVTLAKGGHTDIAAGMTLMLTAGVILAACLTREPHALLLVGALGAAMGVLAIWEQLGHHNYWLDWVHGNHFANLAAYQGDIRARSTIGHPLIAGAVLGAIAMLMVDHPSRWKRLIIPLCLGGCLATVSKSSMIGLGAATVLLLFQNRHRLPRIVPAVVATVVVLYALVALVPSLHHSFETRILGNEGTHREFVRQNALDTIRHDATHDPGALMVGGGVGASSDHLYALGGIRGFFIFDNQYVTLIYDAGVLVLLVTLAIGVDGIARADPAARRRALPALVVLLVVGGFVDAIYWGPYLLLLGLTIGLTCQRRSNTAGATMIATPATNPAQDWNAAIAASPRL